MWLEALRQRDRSVAADPWIERTQRSLWKRLAVRLMFRPEVDVPLMAAAPPGLPDSKLENEVPGGGRRPHAGQGNAPDTGAAPDRKGDEP